VFNLSNTTFFEIDAVLGWEQHRRMSEAERPTCPNCGAHLMPALPPGVIGTRIFRCPKCDGPDPLRTDKVMGWLKSELQSPK